MDIIESNQKQADTYKIIAVVKLNFFFSGQRFGEYCISVSNNKVQERS